MRPVWLALLLACGLGSASADQTAPAQTQNASAAKETPATITQAASAFANPPKQYRPIAWLMLNGDLKPDVLNWELERIKEYNFSGYATYPYRGLTVPYNSGAWWQSMNDMLQRSAQLGLDVWLLDEFNWPSGNCAGYLLRDQPWLRTSPLWHLNADALPGQSVTLAVRGQVISVVFLVRGRPQPTPQQ